MQFTIFVSTLITDDEGKILLVKEKKEKIYDKLNLPGGHLEFMEGIEEGAIREVKEEACVDVEIKGLLAVFNDWAEDHYIHFIFAGKILNGGIPKAGPGHVKDVLWVTEAQFEKMDSDELVSPDKYMKMLEMFRKGLLVEAGTIRELRR